MNAHDDLDLGAILRGHAREGDRGPGLGLGDVQKKAGQIRRRRAAAAGAGVAAALAIIVPAALFGGGVIGGDAGDKEPGVLNSQTPDGEVSIQKGPALDVSDLPRGEAPKVLWLEGRILHTPDGDVELGADNVQGLVPFDDGWAGRDYTADPPAVLIFDSAGDVIDQRESGGGDPVASADGRYVLITTGTALYLHDNQTGEEQLVHEQDELSPTPVGIAYVSDAESGAENQLVAYYNLEDQDGGTRPAYWTDGTETVLEGGDSFESGNQTESPWLRYTAVSDTGSFAALTELQDDGSCSEVIGGHGIALADTCDFQVRSFSPDGSRVQLDPAYGDGFGPSEFALATTEGLETDVHYFQSSEDGPHHAFMGSTWEDEDHVLIVTYTYPTSGAEGTWHLLRIGTDGSVEDAVAPVVASDFDRPFYVL